MANNGKRTVQVCLSDIPKELIQWHGKPAKAYISLTLWDMTYHNHKDQNCVVQITQTEQEILNSQHPIEIGGGIIHNI